MVTFRVFSANSPPDCSWNSVPILTLLMTAKSFAGDFSDRGKALCFPLCIDERGFEALLRCGVQIQKSSDAYLNQL